MPTLSLKLTFKPKGNVSEIEILGKVRSMEQEASCWLMGNKGMKVGIVKKRKDSKRMRQRLLNFWTMMTFHKIMEMEARQYGVSVVFVNSRCTSGSCLVCGESLREQGMCQSFELSRNYEAAINIACGSVEKTPA